ncbi:hypothetical protein [Paraliobacillus sediminis]|uniref:hypothetical protein n=1 Tax=Paraliobacillus sediminis TaxID=1885916 RepID=UPI000E3EC31E|nr:hypothetical protein [Paraliobacillus sediminis]
MKQYIYIASPMKLLNGSFGSTHLSPEQANVFKDELDLTNLSFQNNYDSRLKQKFSYSRHFTFGQQVSADASYIPLKLDLK